MNDPVVKRRVLACLVALSAGLTAQDPRAYAGLWEAKFHDSVFCVLRIETGDKISGTLSAGSISVNDDGELIAAEGSEKDYPILNAKLYDDKLTFDWKDDSDDAAVKFEMKLTGEGQSDLRIVVFDQPNIKPWKLTRK
jgi:hypothetical protein